jgi:hypothetical protein
MGRAPVGEDAIIPKCPAAYIQIQMDLGIVPGAQESTIISNWFQDEIIAAMNKAHSEANIDAKTIDVEYSITVSSFPGAVCVYGTRKECSAARDGGEHIEGLQDSNGATEDIQGG